MITQKRLKEILYYDEKTGELKWRKNLYSRAVKDSVAGCIDNVYGYRLVRIDRKLYRAHRLVWLYFKNEIPKYDIDHINHNRSDNRIENLRSVTRSENMKNGNIRSDNKSGVIGVSWSKSKNKWRATIMIGKEYKHIGYFESFESAKLARKQEESLNGYHKNHGKSI